MVIVSDKRWTTCFDIEVSKTFQILIKKNNYAPDDAIIFRFFGQTLF